MPLNQDNSPFSAHRRRWVIGLAACGLLIGGLIVFGVVRWMASSLVEPPPGAKSFLSSLRAAISIYYGDSGGTYPTNLAVLATKYLDTIPEVKLERFGHRPTREVLYILTDHISGFSDSGKWLYSELNGTICVDCTHTDTHGFPVSCW